MIGKNWLTFGGDPVLDTDSRSLFHFPHLTTVEYGILDFLSFLTQSPANFHDTGWNDIMPTR